MDKSQSGSASPAPLSSSPALRSTPTIPETTVTATEESPSASAADQSRRVDAAPPPPSKSGSLRGTAEPQDTDRSPLNVYAQAATSTISEWFGTSVCAVYCDPPLPAMGGH